MSRAASRASAVRHRRSPEVLAVPALQHLLAEEPVEGAARRPGRAPHGRRAGPQHHEAQRRRLVRHRAHPGEAHGREAVGQRAVAAGVDACEVVEERREVVQGGALGACAARVYLLVGVRRRRPRQAAVAVVSPSMRRARKWADRPWISRRKSAAAGGLAELSRQVLEVAASATPASTSRASRLRRGRCRRGRRARTRRCTGDGARESVCTVCWKPRAPTRLVSSTKVPNVAGGRAGVACAVRRPEDGAHGCREAAVEVDAAGPAGASGSCPAEAETKSCACRWRRGALRPVRLREVLQDAYGSRLSCLGPDVRAGRTESKRPAAPSLPDQARTADQARGRTGTAGAAAGRRPGHRGTGGGGTGAGE